jgi:hypothetical protein
MRLARFAPLAAVLALATGLSSCGGKDGDAETVYSNRYLGGKPPALALAGTTWLNVEGSPGLEKFLGKVVFLEFGFLR